MVLTGGWHCNHTSFEKQIFLKNMSVVREKRSQWKAIEQEEALTSLLNVSTMVFSENRLIHCHKYTQVVRNACIAGNVEVGLNLGYEKADMRQAR